MTYDAATGMNFGNNQDTAKAEFYNEAVQNNFKSEREGRPIFDDVVFVRIVRPGDNKSIVERPAKDEDKHRFPLQWAQFERQEAQTLSGTPLEQWPPMTPALVRSLKAINIPTVEALAGVTDGNLENIGMGARKLRDQAQAFLVAAKDGAANSQLLAENEDLRDQIKALQANFEDLKSHVGRKEAAE